MKLTQEVMTEWLKRVHTMEIDLRQLFKAQMSYLPEDTGFTNEVDKYINNFNQRQERLKSILGEFDEDPSTFKTAVANLLGTIKGSLDDLRSNEVLYALISDLGLLQHAIAFYRVTQIMAQELDQPEAADKLKANFQEHLDLAEKINKQFSHAVKSELSINSPDKSNGKQKDESNK